MVQLQADRSIKVADMLRLFFHFFNTLNLTLGLIVFGIGVSLTASPLLVEVSKEVTMLYGLLLIAAVVVLLVGVLGIHGCYWVKENGLIFYAILTCMAILLEVVLGSMTISKEEQIVKDLRSRVTDFEDIPSSVNMSTWKSDTSHINIGNTYVNMSTWNSESSRVNIGNIYVNMSTWKNGISHVNIGNIYVNMSTWKNEISHINIADISIPTTELGNRTLRVNLVRSKLYLTDTAFKAQVDNIHITMQCCSFSPSLVQRNRDFIRTCISNGRISPNCGYAFVEYIKVRLVYIRCLVFLLVPIQIICIGFDLAVLKTSKVTKDYEKLERELSNKKTQRANTNSYSLEEAEERVALYTQPEAEEAEYIEKEHTL